MADTALLVRQFLGLPLSPTEQRDLRGPGPLYPEEAGPSIQSRSPGLREMLANALMGGQRPSASGMEKIRALTGHGGGVGGTGLGAIDVTPLGIATALQEARGPQEAAMAFVPGLQGGTIAKASRVASPAIRAAEAPLFDYSRLAEVPAVPQFDLERYVPKRGIPERTQALADPANIARVNEVVKQGMGMGGPEWYNTEPLRQAFAAELGGKGDAAYRQYLDLVAATSPRSNVGTNARNASYYYGLAQRGEPLPELMKKVSDKGIVNWSPVEPLPAPYGHIAQGLHVRNANNVLNEGGWPVLQNPKPASFAQNLQGNQMPVTIDTHNARLWRMTDSKGRPVVMPAESEYGFMEKLQQEQAAKLGLTPAQYQAAAWIGGGAETGLRSTADPFLKVFEDRVAKTAEATGQTKPEVLRDFIRGNRSLLSIGAAAAAAPVLGAGEQQADPAEFLRQHGINAGFMSGS